MRVLTLVLLLAVQARAQYVTADGEYLVRDGAPLRLWGIHLSHDAAAPPYARAERLAERLHLLGFNAVVVHAGDDFFWDPDRPGELPVTQAGDLSPLDRLDYFISKLAERGMVVFLTATARLPWVAESDYVGPPEGRLAWWQAVRESYADPRLAAGMIYLQYADPGVQAARLRFLRGLAEHVNPHLGRPYGREPAIAMLALGDGLAFCRFLFDNRWETAWHPYFQERVRGRFQTWLRGKYSDDAAWRAAWGAVSAGESLAAGTVSMRVGIEGDQRCRDVIFYGADAVEAWHRHELAQVRRMAPPGVGWNVIPIASECAGVAAWYNLFGALQGDVGVTGSYWPMTPQRTNLAEPLNFLGPLDGSSLELPLAGKPWVIYATGQPPPQVYRAEYPMRVAVHASLHNAAGVFWHDWATALDDRGYNAAPLFDWSERGPFDLSVDNIVCAQLRVAGHLFRGGAVAPHPRPTVFRYGRAVLDDPEYGLGWYRTDDYLSYAATHHHHGARIAYEPDLAGLALAGGELADEPVPERFEPSPGVVLDRGRELLTVDLPTAKVAVGRLGERFEFGDGIRLSRVGVPFLAFGLVSTDFRPIATSGQVALSAVAGVQPTGFAYAPDGGIARPGRRPLRYRRVQGLLELPRRENRLVGGYSILLAPIPAREAIERVTLEGRDLVLILDLRPADGTR